MKANHQLKACVLAALCVSLPAALNAADENASMSGTGSANTTQDSTHRSGYSGDTEHANANTSGTTTSSSSTETTSSGANASSGNVTTDGTQRGVAAGDTENLAGSTASGTITGASDKNTSGMQDSRANDKNYNDTTSDKSGRMNNSRSDRMNNYSSNYGTMGSTEVTVNNKASLLIGKEVRNNSDEKIGKIKDIVLDMQSGKVSYAVLDGGSMFKPKLFAVPLSAFSTGSDDRYLILNADKSKIETAQGFDKTSWPSVNNPDWGADHIWQQSDSNSMHNDQNHNMHKSMDKNDRYNSPSASPYTPTTP